MRPLQSTMVQTVVLVANGEIKAGRVADATAAGIAKALRKTRQPTVVGTYTWDEQVLTLWGWAEGRAGTENKHELPPPHDKSLWFGDIIVTAAAGDFSVAAWKEFYDAAFKGFEDLGSEDSEDDEEGEGEEEDDEEDAELEEAADGDGDGDGDDESAAGSEGGEDGDGGDDGDGEAEGEEDEEDVEEADDDECYDSDGGGGGGKRRAPRRRAMAAPEYRRMDMGLRSKIKLPLQVGRRAPRWQTAVQLEPEP